MNTIRQLKKSDLIKAYLDKGFSVETAGAEIDFAIDIISGLTPKDLIIGIMPSLKDIQKLYNVVKRRLETGEPMAQILGFAFFMGKKFEVSKDTLIPRPETELLVRKAVELIKENDFKQALDIGTGTGCIACMCAKLTTAQVLGVDISNNALKIALNNAMHLDLMNRALFRKSDLFEKIRPEEKFDIIISNPPYIPLVEKPSLQPEVRDFEPHDALFTQDEQGVEFYEKIAQKAPEFLNKSGYLLFELGAKQACTVKKILAGSGFSEIEIQKDVSGIERVICGRLM